MSYFISARLCFWLCENFNGLTVILYSQARKEIYFKQKAVLIHFNSCGSKQNFFIVKTGYYFYHTRKQYVLKFNAAEQFTIRLLGIPISKFEIKYATRKRSL